MASVSRKIRRDDGALRPITDSAATANAISVATGMGQPPEWPPKLIVKYITAGTIMPPNAALIGNTTLAGSDSSPCTSSRLSSRPTTKKKIVINPSLTQSWIDRSISNLPAPAVSASTAWDSRISL